MTRPITNAIGCDGHLLESRTTEEFVSGKRVRPVTIRLAAL